MKTALLPLDQATTPAGKPGTGRNKGGGRDDAFAALVTKTADTRGKSEHAPGKTKAAGAAAAPKLALAAVKSDPRDTPETLEPSDPPLAEKAPVKAARAAGETQPATEKRPAAQARPVDAHPVEEPKPAESEPQDTLAILMAAVTPPQNAPARAAPAPVDEPDSAVVLEDGPGLAADADISVFETAEPAPARFRQLPPEATAGTENPAPILRRSPPAATAGTGTGEPAPARFRQAPPVATETTGTEADAVAPALFWQSLPLSPSGAAAEEPADPARAAEPAQPPRDALAALLGERRSQVSQREPAQPPAARAEKQQPATTRADGIAASPPPADEPPARQDGASAARQPAAPAMSDPAAGKRETAAPLLDQKITIVSQQVAPAPAVPVAAPSPTGAALVSSLEADGTLRSYASEAAMPAADARPVTTLKLQLHPAELGNVTVRITGAGDEIAIDIQVENTEARHRLSSDSDAIVKSLRGLGYDVDRITVQQVAATAGASQQQGATGGGRGDGFGAFEQRSGDRGQDQDANRNGREDGRQQRAAPQAQADRGGAAGAVYI